MNLQDMFYLTRVVRQNFELADCLWSVPYRILIKKRMGKEAFALASHIAGSLNKTVQRFHFCFYVCDSYRTTCFVDNRSRTASRVSGESLSNSESMMAA